MKSVFVVSRVVHSVATPSFALTSTDAVNKWFDKPGYTIRWEYERFATAMDDRGVYYEIEFIDIFDEFA